MSLKNRDQTLQATLDIRLEVFRFWYHERLFDAYVIAITVTPRKGSNNRRAGIPSDAYWTGWKRRSVPEKRHPAVDPFGPYSERAKQDPSGSS